MERLGQYAVRHVERIWSLKVNDWMERLCRHGALHSANQATTQSDEGLFAGCHDEQLKVIIFTSRESNRCLLDLTTLQPICSF
jgi:hypothetical protein